MVNPNFKFKNLIVGRSNKSAFECAKMISINPGKKFNPLFICGETAVGKTFLMHAIGNKLKYNFPKFKVLYVTSEKFDCDFIDAIKSNNISKFRNKYRNIDCLLIDDIQFLTGKHNSQEEFRALFNILKNNEKQIVIASDRHQDKLKIEENLKTMFKYGKTVDILPPNLKIKTNILKEKAKEENISISKDIINFLTHKTNDIRELQGMLLRVITLHTFAKEPITLNMLKNSIKELN